MDHKKFIEEVSLTAGLGKQDCDAFLRALIETIENSISEGDTITIPAFGNFEPRKRNERIMASPTNPGSRILIPPKLVVSFKASATLKSKINNPPEE